MATAVEDEGAENPLVEGLERLPVPPTTLVIFGATGDLAQRKLLPALYNLAHEGALPERFNLIGVSRSEKTDEDFRAECERGDPAVLAPRRPTPTCSKGLLETRRATSGHRSTTTPVYGELGRCSTSSTRRRGEPLNRAFYLSTAPRVLPGDRRAARQRRA